MDIDRMSKDIRDKIDREFAVEFTKVIGNLLLENGVSVDAVEYKNSGYNSDKNTLEFKYGVSITGIDFTEHDRPFKEKIDKLETKNNKIKGLIE